MQELKLVEIEDEVFRKIQTKDSKDDANLSPGLNSETAIALLKTHRRSPKQRNFWSNFIRN